MLAQVKSFVLQGIEGIPCEVEVDAAERGIAKTTIVGLPDASVKEAIERVRSAMVNVGYGFPATRLLVNLAPAEVKKEGPVFDLPIAIGLLCATGTIESQTHHGLLFAGELALDGRLRPIKGVLSMAMLARQAGARGIVVPAANASEASVVSGLAVYAAERLAEVVGHLNGVSPLAPLKGPGGEFERGEDAAAVDFGYIRGQEAVKRAATVAAAGGHNLLMIGPAGTGKTMMAKALPGILPPLTRAEALETTRVYSAAGLLEPGRRLLTQRPVRSPHHTASAAAIVGGGAVPRPGEVSLAHHGILFLDETPEFARSVLETLRQPLEDGVVTVARAHSTIRYPARFMLVAALNPTPGGDVAEDAVSRRQMDRYLSRISGPLADRIDLHVEVPRVPYDQLRGKPDGTNSQTMREAVVAARAVQARRSGDPALVNARLTGRQLDEVASLSANAERLLERAMTELKLSARAFDKIRRVARTIADLGGSDALEAEHVGEAIGYRLLDRRF